MLIQRLIQNRGLNLAASRNKLDREIKLPNMNTYFPCPTLAHQDLQSHDRPTSFTCGNIQKK